MGNLVRGVSTGERRHLAYALVAVGTLVIVAVCALWHAESPTTPHSVLLIVGCELAIAGLGIRARTPALAGGDLRTFIARCLAESLFGAALAFAAITFIFDQTKSADRLGYFLGALVVVPGSVVLSYRLSDAADADARSGSEPAILLLLTAAAIGAARVWGPGYVSLKLLLFLLAARALAAVASRTRVGGEWLPSGARPFAVMPLVLAGTALAFAPADQLTFGHLVLGVAAGVAVGVGWVCFRSLTAVRAVRVSIDAIAVLVCILVVFRLGLPDSAIAANGNYFLGPADDILHGHPMLIDTYSQYGVGMLDALAGVFSILPLGYGDLQLLISTLTALQWVAIYGVVRMGTKSQLAAILAVVVGIWVFLSDPYGVFSDYPSVGVLRFGLPWLVVLLSVGSALIRGDRRRRYLDVAVLVIIAIAAEWSGETGIYCLGTGCAIACVNAAASSAPLMQRARAGVRSIARLLGAYVLGILLFTVITRLAAGRWPDWGPYVDFLRLYTTGGLGEQEIGAWSPGLAVGGIYVASATVIVGVLVARPDTVGERLPAFRAAAGLTAMGPLVYTYFLGRSHPSNLFWVSPPFVALVFVWLGIACASFDVRMPAVAAIASVTFVSGVVLAATGPVFEAVFPGTALYDTVIRNGQLDPDFDTDQMKWTKSILRGLAVPAETLEQMRQLAWLTVNRSEFVNYKINMRVKKPTDPVAATQFAVL